ncbi:MAG: class I SAM-dependent methyltransferase [Phenylobacterium sp.]
MARTRAYYAEGSLSAAFYDVVAASDPRLSDDVEIYEALAPPGAKVLELGAGAGRVTAALAAGARQVTGVDIAPAMLAQAVAAKQALPAEVAARVTLRRGDMTALYLQETFDRVICPFFTLAHVPTGAAWRNTFATAARHLDPGGLAAFHLPMLEKMRSLGPADSDLPVMDRPLANGGRLLLYLRERSFREAIGRLEQVIEYVELDPKGVVARRSPERLTYYMTDPTPLAADAGLVLDREPIPLGPAGEIWVFRKT